jgi:hypothetical protein
MEYLEALWSKTDEAAARTPRVSTLRSAAPVEPPRAPDYSEPTPHYSRAAREFRQATADQWRRDNF